MVSCPSCHVNGKMGLTSCGGWLVTVGVGVVTTVDVKDTIVVDGVTIVGATSVVVGTNADVSKTEMLRLISICVVVLVIFITVGITSVVIVVDGTSMILVTFGDNTCEENITSVVSTTGSVVGNIIILLTDGVMKLISLKLGEGETSSLVVAVITLGSIVLILDTFIGVGVMMTTVVINVGTRSALESITSLISDGDINLVVVTSGSVVMNTLLSVTTDRSLGEITLGDRITLVGIVKDGVTVTTSLVLITSLIVTGKTMVILISGCVVTSLAVNTDTSVGEAVGIILGNIVEGGAMVATSLVLMKSLGNGKTIVVVISGCSLALAVTTDRSLGEIILGVGIALGSIVKDGATVANSLVLITSLIIVTGTLGGKAVVVVTMLLTTLIFIITLVTGGAVKLNVSSTNGDVVVGNIISLLTTLVIAVATVGVTGRLTIIPVVSSTLVTITLGIDDVMMLEMTKDGIVVRGIISVVETLVSTTTDGVLMVTNTDVKSSIKDVLAGT